MNTPKSTQSSIKIPALEAEAIMPAASLDMLITTLTNPAVRYQVTAQLTERIEARSKELEPLLEIRKALDTLTTNQFSKDSNPIPETKFDSQEKEKVTSMIGTHVIAIAVALEDEKNGLTLADLRVKLDKMGHAIEYKILQNTIRRMVKRGEIKTKGPSGHFRYKLSIKL